MHEEAEEGDGWKAEIGKVAMKNSCTSHFMLGLRGRMVDVIHYPLTLSNHTRPD
jgi:hypothetical protein